MHRSGAPRALLSLFLSPPGVFAASPTPSGKERKSSPSSSCSPLASTLLRRSPGLDHPAVDSLTVLYATPLCLKEARSALSEAARASPVCTELRTRRFLPDVRPRLAFSRRIRRARPGRPRNQPDPVSAGHFTRLIL